MKQARAESFSIWVTSSALAHGLALALILQFLPVQDGTRSGDVRDSLRVSLVLPSSNQTAKPDTAAVWVTEKDFVAAKPDEAVTASTTVARLEAAPMTVPHKKTETQDTLATKRVAVETVPDMPVRLPRPTDSAQQAAPVEQTRQAATDVYQPKAKPSPERMAARVAIVKREVPVGEDMPVSASESQAGGAAADYGYLLGLLHREISRHKRYPFMARRRHVEGTATVGFSLNSVGVVRGAGVVDSSGHGMLDRAAVAAVQGISPFGAAAAYLGEDQDFRVQVAFRLR